MYLNHAHEPMHGSLAILLENGFRALSLTFLEQIKKQKKIVHACI